MDLFHIDLLYQTLLLGKFKRALEIGCYAGVSSQAFIRALESNVLGGVTFCDTSIRYEFPKDPRIVVMQCPSRDVIDGSYDFALVDGDHTLPVVAVEAMLLLYHGVETIVAHDTLAARVGFPECDGPPILREVLRKCGYDVLEDALTRDRMRTDRGFMVATKRPDLAIALRPYFNPESAVP